MLTLSAGINGQLPISYVVKVDPVYTYKPLKTSLIGHQNDQEVMIFHTIYDSIVFDRENQKRRK